MGNFSDIETSLEKRLKAWDEKDADNHNRKTGVYATIIIFYCLYVVV